MKPFIPLFTALLLSACTTAAPPAAPAPAATAQPAADRLIRLDNSRCTRRICTREYNPVCATIDDNGRLHRQTFGNHCSVCSDTGKILSVSEGACGSLQLR